MRNHEPHYAINLSVENEAKWVGALPIKETFLKEEMWPFLIKITSASPNIQLPEIMILENNPDIDSKAIATYDSPKNLIILYENDIFESCSYLYNRDQIPFNLRECIIFAKDILAHEALHHIYSYTYESGLTDHQKMDRDKSLSKISKIIGKKMNSTGYAEKITEVSLQNSILNDKELMRPILIH
jgi:hypothetical protein